uniref:Transcription factor bHLH25-like isoform X1 n=1 Tax=Cicer arietinum TaxID=3827 RepID=A0A1S2Z5Q1_CICAR|nr:transcription factor bHLH25-like isoform X1 [Cicer arietinum]
MDDSSIIEKVKNYVKQLQERVRELEQEVGSNNICSNKDTTSCKMKSHDYNCGTTSNILPEVKARVLQKEILIIIHCEKQKDVMLKILTHLENLHLSLVNSSVLRFGKSNLDITIIAQMDDGYNIKLDELVQTLRLAIST